LRVFTKTWYSKTRSYQNMVPVWQNKVLPYLTQKWYGNCCAVRTDGTAHAHGHISEAYDITEITDPKFSICLHSTESFLLLCVVPFPIVGYMKISRRNAVTML